MTFPRLARDGEIDIIQNNMPDQTAADRFNRNRRVDRFSQFALNQWAQVDVHNLVLKQKIGAYQAQKPDSAPKKPKSFTRRHLHHQTSFMKTDQTDAGAANKASAVSKTSLSPPDFKRTVWPSLTVPLKISSAKESST